MKQIRKNLITNILCLLTNFIVGLLYTPYLVRELGVVAYGVLPLAFIINQYIIILTESLQNSVTRFYSVAYRSGNYYQASIFISSAIVITLLLPLCALPIIALLLPRIEEVLNIPEELIHSVGYLILYSCSSLFLSIISNSINITAYSDNRLDLINYLKIIRNCSKLVFNIVLFEFLSIDVANVGLSSMASEFITLIGSIIIYKLFKPKQIAFRKQYISFTAMVAIVKMLSWVSLISFSSVFIYKIDSLFINNYFGLYYTGVLGSMSEFGTYCISIAGLIGVLYRPLMLISYSEGKHEDLVQITTDGAYVSGLLSSLLCGIVMGVSSSLLRIWLNDEIAVYNNWLLIKMILIPITTFGSTFSIVYNLWNKVKEGAIWSFVIAVSYVVLSILLLEMGVGVTLFLCLGTITAITQGTVLHIIIYSKLYPESMRVVYTKLIKCVLFFAVVFVFSSVVDLFFEAYNVLTLLIEAALCGALALVIIPLFLRGREIDALDVVIPIKIIIRKINIKSNHNGEL